MGSEGLLSRTCGVNSFWLWLSRFCSHHVSNPLGEINTDSFFGQKIYKQGARLAVPVRFIHTLTLSVLMNVV
jgi:hypothetical protein